MARESDDARTINRRVEIECVLPPGDPVLPSLLVMERTNGEPRLVGACGLGRKFGFDGLQILPPRSRPVRVAAVDQKCDVVVTETAPLICSVAWQSPQTVSSLGKARSRAHSGHGSSCVMVLMIRQSDPETRALALFAGHNDGSGVIGHGAAPQGVRPFLSRLLGLLQTTHHLLVLDLLEVVVELSDGPE